MIWVLNRPGDYDNDPIFRRPEVTENYASLKPATAMCCLKPEGILAFDMQGNLIHHWNQADKVDGHLILSDRPGWGTEPNEEAMRAHPPKDKAGLLTYGQKNKS